VEWQWEERTVSMTTCGVTMGRKNSEHDYLWSDTGKKERTVSMTTCGVTLGRKNSEHDYLWSDTGKKEQWAWLPVEWHWEERTVSMTTCGVTLGRKTEELREYYHPSGSSFTVYLTWIIQASRLSIHLRVRNEYVVCVMCLAVCTFFSSIPVLHLTISRNVLIYFLLTVCFVANSASFFFLCLQYKHKNLFVLSVMQ